MTTNDNTLGWKCNLDYCDVGWHVEEPTVERGYIIRTGYSDLEEYGSYDTDLVFIPLSEGIVEQTAVWRMACGAWFVAKPERMTKKQATEEFE